MTPPNIENHFYQAHCQRLSRSFARLMGRPLAGIDSEDPSLGEQLFHSSAVIVSHDTQDDPIFNYANQQALDLFEMTWPQFTQLPSRHSAEQPNREERARLLHQVTTHGFIDNYRGIRISATGQRFMINNAIVWNLYDEQDHYYGQAATFSDWAIC